jgi:hypothetical protein
LLKLAVLHFKPPLTAGGFIVRQNSFTFVFIKTHAFVLLAFGI